MHVEEAVDRAGFGAFQRRLFLVCGVTWAAWLVERWGRKPVLAAYLAAAGAATLLWAAAGSAALVLTAAALVNFFALGAWAALYAYTPERYPTPLRATGIGAAAAMPWTTLSPRSTPRPDGRSIPRRGGVIGVDRWTFGYWRPPPGGVA